MGLDLDRFWRSTSITRSAPFDVLREATPPVSGERCSHGAVFVGSSVPSPLRVPRTTGRSLALEERQKLFREFSPGFFDLIVVDKCYRGSAAEDLAWVKSSNISRPDANRPRRHAEGDQIVAPAVRKYQSILVEASVPICFMTEPFELQFVSHMQHAALEINDHQVVRRRLSQGLFDRTGRTQAHARRFNLAPWSRPGVNGPGSVIAGALFCYGVGNDLPGRAQNGTAQRRVLALTFRADLYPLAAVRCIVAERLAGPAVVLFAEFGGGGRSGTGSHRRARARE